MILRFLTQCAIYKWIHADVYEVLCCDDLTTKKYVNFSRVMLLYWWESADCLHWEVNKQHVMLFMMIMMKFADTILGMFNLLECQNLYVFFCHETLCCRFNWYLFLHERQWIKYSKNLKPFVYWVHYLMFFYF